MKRFFLTAAIILLAAGVISAETLRIGIYASLQSGSSEQDSTKTPIFHGILLLPVGETRDIFTGPYTLSMNAENAADGYDLSCEFFGLGPDYHSAQYKMALSPGDPMIIPPLPVKVNTRVIYNIKLLNDTATFVSSEPDENDTTSWGISESVHYRTHWIKGSQADYFWNLKMGYLELIYNQYRSNLLLSMSQKIDLYFHPDTSSSTFLMPGTVSVIQPRKARIDLVFGHDIDAVDPRPGAILLLYRLWGYGPRWMVTGFAGYYEDGLLRLRKMAGQMDAAKLSHEFADESWVDSDTGLVTTGAFVSWLLETQSISKFKQLYSKATSLDIKEQYQQIYGQSLETAIANFIDYARNYRPKKGELEYYASHYMDFGDYRRATDYLEELAARRGKDSGKYEKQLALCQFWQGDYDAAMNTVEKQGSSSEDPERETFATELRLATGKARDILAGYQSLYTPKNSPEDLLMTSILCDQGNLEKASRIIDSLKGEVTGTVDYMIEAGRLRILKGQNADSILTQVAARSLTRAQAASHDPMNYYMAGRAFSLMGQYDKAKENLQTSYFLERRPYFQGVTLLELGRLADLEGKRDDAEKYYGQVISMNAGAYQKSLAKKYLENRYVNGH